MDPARPARNRHRWIGLLALVLLAASATGIPVRRAAAQAPTLEDARTPISRLYDGLLDAMKRAETLGYEGRARELAPLIEEVYDLPFMAAKVLGRTWNDLSEEQKRHWIDTFSRLTIYTYADRFDGYSGEALEVEGAEEAGRETVIVRTRIVPVDEKAVDVDYRLHERAGGWRVVDVYLNGTVSELALRRSEYSSAVKREGLDALIAKLEEKIRDPDGDGDGLREGAALPASGG